MTSIHVTRYVDCPFSAALELAEKAVSKRSGFYLTPSPPLGERVQFAVRSVTDASDAARKHEALLLAWRPQAHMLPDFRGAMTVRPYHRGVSLRLSGRYEPPYGLAGKLFDLIAGRTIARRTLTHFIDELARDIESEYARERSTGRAQAHA